MFNSKPVHVSLISHYYFYVYWMSRCGLVVSQLEGLEGKARCPSKTATTCVEGSTQRQLLHYRHLTVYCGCSIYRSGLKLQADDRLSLFCQHWFRKYVQFIAPASVRHHLAAAVERETKRFKKKCLRFLNTCQCRNVGVLLPSLGVPIVEVYLTRNGKKKLCLLFQ